MKTIERKYPAPGKHPILGGQAAVRVLVAGALCLPMMAEAAGKGRARSTLETPASDFGVSDSDAGARPEIVHEGVTGVVLDASDAPIADVLVQPSSLGGASPIPEMAVMTGPDGHFTWKLKPGRYRMDVIVDGRAIASANVTVKRGALSSVQLRARR